MHENLNQSEDTIREDTSKDSHHKDGGEVEKTTHRRRKEYPVVNGIIPNVLFLSRFSILTTTISQIRELCEKYGPTMDISLKGKIAFVDFVHSEDASKAKSDLHHNAFLGSDSLICDFKKHQASRDDAQYRTYGDFDRRRTGNDYLPDKDSRDYHHRDVRDLRDTRSYRDNNDGGGRGGLEEDNRKSSRAFESTSSFDHSGRHRSYAKDYENTCYDKDYYDDRYPSSSNYVDNDRYDGKGASGNNRGHRHSDGYSAGPTGGPSGSGDLRDEVRRIQQQQSQRPHSRSPPRRRFASSPPPPDHKLSNDHDMRGGSGAVSVKSRGGGLGRDNPRMDQTSSSFRSNVNNSPPPRHRSNSRDRDRDRDGQHSRWQAPVAPLRPLGRTTNDLPPSRHRATHDRDDRLPPSNRPPRQTAPEDSHVSGGRRALDGPHSNNHKRSEAGDELYDSGHSNSDRKRFRTRSS